MKIGYASITVGVLDTNYRNITLKYLNDDKLIEVIDHNLNVLNKIIDYNISNNIKLFRISSNIIPFGSSEYNQIKWWEIFNKQLLNIGNKINENNIRVSMHPGQYTVLNSLNPQIVERAILDLEYHNLFLDSLKVNQEHKMILHIGGVYGDKGSAIDRFVQNYHLLNDNIKARLVIENDDRAFTITDLLTVYENTKAPIVYDNLHHKINPSEEFLSDLYWIEVAKKTWNDYDGHQKIHYSQQHPFKQKGSHSDTIIISEFMKFYQQVNREDLDIMLEVKDKNLSALKCITCVNNDLFVLNQEWDKYKYLVLEKSPTDYRGLQEIDDPVVVYEIIHSVLTNKDNPEYVVNAFLHLWGYIKEHATSKENIRFNGLVDKYLKQLIPKTTVKRYMWRLIEKYQIIDLQRSYYFLI